MIHVEFNPESRPELLTEEQREWFMAWKLRAQQATDRVIRAWEAWRLSKKNPESLTDTQRIWLAQWKASPDAKRLQHSKDDKFKYTFEDDIWSEMKNWLLEHIFYFKCAYCEKNLRSQPRHAEHFRPKAQVRLGKSKARIKDDSDQEITHPGYFWLAYHWQNLMPSCTFCNTVNGKKDKFPVLKDYAPMMRQLTGEVFDLIKPRIIRSQIFDEIYYLQPSDLDLLEGRMILHPCLEDPQEYLSFDELGNAIAVGDEEKKKIAQCSIETYNLNGDGLVKERLDAQREAWNDYDIAIIYNRKLNLAARNDEKAIKKAAKDAVLAKFTRREQPYSAAVLAGLKLHDPETFS